MKPEIKQYHDGSGQLIKEEYWLNGQYHREDGPAYRRWNEGGRLIREIYWFNGLLHREDGPAMVQWFANGKLAHEEYRLNGKKISKNEFLARCWYNIPIEKFS